MNTFNTDDVSTANARQSAQGIGAKKTGRGKSFISTSNRQKTITLWVLLTIPIVHWFVFWFYVNIQSIVLAFQDLRTGAFTLQNFTTVWERIVSPINNDIGISLINTLKYFGAAVLIDMPLCLAIAYFFYKKIAGYKLFRIIFYLPAIISSMVLVTAYKEFIDPTGPLGKIIRLFGGTPNPIIATARVETATTAILIYTVLTGFTTNVLLFSGAMSRVPIEVIEAAKLDGCGPGVELCKIIFPIILPTFSAQLIFAMTGIFNSSGPILLFTNGKYDTSTVSYWIFAQVYGDGAVGGSGKYNVVSCAGLCFTLIGYPLILIARKLTDKIDLVEF